MSLWEWVKQPASNIHGWHNGKQPRWSICNGVLLPDYPALERWLDGGLAEEKNEIILNKKKKGWKENIRHFVLSQFTLDIFFTTKNQLAIKKKTEKKGVVLSF